MSTSGTVLKGVGVSPGVAMAVAHVVTRHALIPNARAIAQPAAEIERLRTAIAQTAAKLEGVAERAAQAKDADQAAIFQAHAMMLSDPVLFEGASEVIRSHHVCAERAFAEQVEQFAILLAAAEDPYLRGRAVDLRDICRQVVARLTGDTESDDGRASLVLVSDELYPSDTIAISRQRLMGLVSRQGSDTSHTAIMARTLGIPAVVGLEDVSAIRPGVRLIVDGDAGLVIVDPSPEDEERFQQVLENAEREKERFSQFALQRATSPEGRPIDVLANIGDTSDVDLAVAFGAEGVGLFRTEFLFMRGPGLPSEEDQEAAYKTVLQRMGERPVALRTLDIGGDKHVPGLTLPRESNPFLGCRAIRLCLERPELFLSQLRAILRASIYGNPQLLFPMITASEELDQALTLLHQAEMELGELGVPYRKLPIGVMIEVPAAALIADVLAKRVDFLTIGTNDLIQYTLAADRLNERISYLRRQVHPAVWKLIKMTVDGAHAHGKPVSVCGELAGDPEAAVELVRLGVDKLSMAPSSIGRIKAALISA